MQTTHGILSADYKVSGGKLVRVRLTLIEKPYPIISSIKLTGDFFIHPEDAIETLEDALTGIAYQEETIRNVVNTFYATGVEVLGAAPEDLVHVILSAGSQS